MLYRRKHLNRDSYIRTTSSKNLQKFINKLSDKSIMIGKSFNGELFKDSLPYEGTKGYPISFTIISYNRLLVLDNEVKKKYFGKFNETYYNYIYNVIDNEGNRYSFIIKIVDKLCYPKGFAKVYSILSSCRDEVDFLGYHAPTNLVLYQFKKFKLNF